MQIIDGKATAAVIRTEIKRNVSEMVRSGIGVPHLVAVLVGHDPASESYVAYKIKDCEEVGFRSGLIRRPDTITEGELLKIVYDLNNNRDVDGFIVQLPLPGHIDEQKIIKAIDPAKDVDGFHPQNIGSMALGLDCYLPATPAGIVELLKRHNIPSSGRHCVVVGRSHIVGSPMSILMSRNADPGNATVTLCHSRTEDLSFYTRQADILITAIGRPETITADMIKEGAVVLDVGTTRVEDPTKKNGYRLLGDVKFEEVAPKCSWISPVPGGVGPMTRVSLLQNTLKATRRHRS